MNDLSTVLINLIVSAITSFLVAKYYGERWVETRRSRIEHSVKLNDFLKPWLDKINEYCKVDAQYSNEIRKMIPLEPREPNDLPFYGEASTHLENYKTLVNDWKNLKQITLKLNKELAMFFEEIRVLMKKELDIPYYCAGYSGDEPDEYVCPNTFIRAVYEEEYWRLKNGKKKFYGDAAIVPTLHGKKILYYLKWGYSQLARSPNEDLMKRAQRLFSQFIEDERCIEKIKAFTHKQKETYDEELEKVKLGIGDIIKSIELGNVIKGKCRYCP